MFLICRRLIATYCYSLFCSLVFVRAIQTAVLLLSDREITLNPCSSIRFIRLEILCIINILGLPSVYALSRFFLLLTSMLCRPLIFLAI